MTTGKCNGCGRTDHAGGCDLVDFYFFQRFGKVNDTPPPPPSPLIQSLTPGVDEGTPLSLGTDILTSPLSVISNIPVFVDKSVDSRGTVFQKETVKRKPGGPKTERIIGEKVRARNAKQQAYRDRKKAERVSG